ncbi:carbohydrate kinase family protein [Serinibacter salmoneus]|uniref:Fructokinase n=1 Tax=Serinibacter salmoneus TaxID=556530 RepID=A0A2A9D224_9MICO|nr:carbohydrate kinase [Serinibacter salmoneus]PFG20421.1 fructokinase [Serinibacter salmoneus]
MQALVIGEALVDIVQRPGQETAVYPGGSPANVAIGLARLGRTVQLLTWLGEDEHGDLVREHLEASRVQLAHGAQRAPRTSSAVATIAPDGSATYEFDLEIDYPSHVLAEEAAVIHLGSIGAVLEPGGSKAVALAAAAKDRCTLTYDPNLRPSIMGEPDDVRATVSRITALSDVVKVSDEDLAWLEPGRDPLEVAQEWATTGPALVVVTLGSQGSLAVSAQGAQVHIPAPAVVVADTVGAGDSFMGGLIDWLWSANLLGSGTHAAIAALSADELAALLTTAARIAAITVSRPGANPPTRLELDGSP